MDYFEHNKEANEPAKKLDSQLREGRNPYDHNPFSNGKSIIMETGTFKCLQLDKPL